MRTTLDRCLTGGEVGRGRIYSRRTHTEPFAGYPGPVVSREVDHERASRWVSEQLPDRILSALDFACGTWTAPLPEGTPPEVANDFRRGVLPEPATEEWQAYDAAGLEPEMVERMVADLQCTAEELILVPKMSLVLYPARWIVDHLAADQENLALIREMTPEAVEGVPTWRGEAGTFYALAGSSWDQERVAHLLDDAAASWGEFALLTTATADRAESRDISGEELLGFVARSAGIIVGPTTTRDTSTGLARDTVQQAHQPDAQTRGGCILKPQRSQLMRETLGAEGVALFKLAGVLALCLMLTVLAASCVESDDYGGTWSNEAHGLTLRVERSGEGWVIHQNGDITYPAFERDGKLETSGAGSTFERDGDRLKVIVAPGLDPIWLTRQ